MTSSRRFASTTALTMLGVALSQGLSASASAAQGEPPASAQVNQIADIIVTAQRREERNQDVPVAITALSTESLKQLNITSNDDLNSKIPSLLVSPDAQGPRDTAGFTLRGIRSAFQGSPSTVIYLAEVPLIVGVGTPQQGGPGNFVDLENVQVLAGPQGTLFGRNTISGAVLLVPHKPTNEFEGYLEGSIGNYDYRAVEAVINVPLVDDRIMIRAAGTFQDRDGYTRDFVWNKDRDDRHFYAGRIGITIRPTETFENYLLAYGSKSDNNGTGHIHRGFNIPGLIGRGTCTDGTPTATVASCDVYRRQSELAQELGPRGTRHGLDSFEKTETWGVINTSTLDLSDELVVRNIISYQRYKKDFIYDGDATPLQVFDSGAGPYPDFPIPGLTDEFGIPTNGFQNEASGGPRDHLKQFTEELQLQGNMLDNRLNFTIGGFYSKTSPVGVSLNRGINSCPAALTGSLASCAYRDRYFSVGSTSKALFAQATLDMGAFSPALDTLRLTGGVRYTWDKISGFGRSFRYVSFTPLSVRCTNINLTTPNPEDCDFIADLKSNAPTWTVGVDYRPVSDLLLYAKVSRGYRSGGFNVSSVRLETQTFGIEKVTSYEAGFKSDWKLGSMPVRWNLTAYQSDYPNLNRLVTDIAGTLAGAGYYRASAKVKGVETELTIRPIPAVELGGSLSYTDGKWIKSEFITPLPAVACNGNIPAGGLADASCDSFGISKWIYNIRASVHLPVPESYGDVSLFANYARVSRRADSILGGNDREPGSVFEPYGLLNMSLDWNRIAGSSFDATLFATNLTNKLYRVSNANQWVGFNVLDTIYGEPRMYGLRLRYRFGGE